MNQLTDESEETVLDLEALKARCLGNLELVERVLAKVTGQLDADLMQLEQAIQAGNSDQAATVAHRIKGVAGSVSAKRLYEDAAIAEQTARDSGVTDLPRWLDRMHCDRSALASTIERTSLTVP